MFERFTDRARRVLVLAANEARTLNHNYLGTEHLLLGAIAEGEGVAARSLTALGVTLEEARDEVQEIIGVGGKPFEGNPPFTPRARKALEMSFKEALQLGHNYIGTEHLLLGLVREGEGVAAQLLVKRLGSLGVVREEVMKLVKVGGKMTRAEIRREGVMQWLQEGRPIARALESFGISLEDFRRRVEEILGEEDKGKEPPAETGS